MQEDLGSVGAALAEYCRDCLANPRRQGALQHVSKQRAEYGQHKKYHLVVDVDWLCILRGAAEEGVVVVLVEVPQQNSQDPMQDRFGRQSRHSVA
jgi:hypothetical protein